MLAQSLDLRVFFTILKVFFTVVLAAPTAVTTSDVLRFIEVQRQPRHGNVVIDC